MSTKTFQVTPELSEGKKWQGVYNWLLTTVTNAGIAFSPSGYLAPIDPTDSEGIKWAKFGALFTVLANGISGGGGGSGGSGYPASKVITTAISSTLGVNTFTVVTAAGPTTQTLPLAPTVGTVCEVKNQGAGTVTVASGGGAIIFAGGAVSTYTPGGVGGGGIGTAGRFLWDGIYWNVL